MSNYPDNFTGTNMDDRPEETHPVEVAQIENAQAAYREIIEATVLILKKRGLTHYSRRPVNHEPAIDWLSFTDIAAILEHAVAGEIKALENEGYEYIIAGEDAPKFFDKMYVLLKTPFRPESTRGTAPQNPATLAGRGEDA